MNIKTSKFYHYLSRKKARLYLAAFQVLQLFVPVKYLWHKFAQSGELEHHIHDKWRQTPDFMANTSKLMSYMGYNPESFKEKIVVDVGSGSKLRSKYFKSSKIVAIDPLIDDYIKNILWSDINDAYKSCSVEAEEFVSELKNTADFVMCINVLDHTYNPQKVLENIYGYLNDNGEFLLSLDLNNTIPNPQHQVAITKEKLERWLNEVRFNIKRMEKYEKSNQKKAYGSTGVAMNYILVK